MMDWYGGGWGVLGWLVMALMMLLFWGLLVFGAVALFRAMGRDGGPVRGGHGEAERLLDERFARGEIDADEYTSRRDLLRRR